MMRRNLMSTVSTVPLVVVPVPEPESNFDVIDELGRPLKRVSDNPSPGEYSRRGDVITLPMQQCAVRVRYRHTPGTLNRKSRRKPVDQ
jgi:hypothetical protein